MRNLLFISLFVSCLFAFNAKAQCSFDQYGSTIISSYAALSDIAVAPDNKLYSISFNTNIGKLELKTAVSIGSPWTVLATSSQSITVKPVINIRNDGRIYIFIRDESGRFWANISLFG